MSQAACIKEANPWEAGPTKHRGERKEEGTQQN